MLIMLRVCGLSRVYVSGCDLTFFKWVSVAIKCLLKVYSLLKLQHYMVCT